MRRAVLLVPMVIASACGSRTPLPAPEAQTGPHCEWTVKFDTVTPLSIQPTVQPGDLQLRLSTDELTGYFERGGDIYVTHRSAIDAPFDMPTAVTEVNSEADDVDPFLTADGLALFFASDRPRAGGGNHLFVARRARQDAPFAPPARVAVNSTDAESAPYLTNDALWFNGYYGSPGVYRAATSGGGFGVPARVDELTATTWRSSAGYPVVSADGLVVYVAAIPSTSTDNGTKIYVAHRENASSKFSTPSVVSEISTARLDVPSWLSRDGCRLYLTRGEPDVYTYRLYVATRH